MVDPLSATTRAAVGSPEDILRRAGGLAERRDFPSVDALHRAIEELRLQAPGLVTRQDVGTSRLGETLPLYRIGDGARSVLVVGGVHPNEPIGSWTVLHLVEQLIHDQALRDGADSTWWVIPCVDPDAMRLNEGWFADPGDRVAYAREFYRPAPDEQVEWTFPFAYKKAHFDAMMPETRALAAAIDIAEPDVYVPLHNSEAGGAYYYVSRPAPELYGLLHAIPASLSVPLHQGEAEAAHYTKAADAIFETGTLEQAYDWAEAMGFDPYPTGSGGADSTSYAGRHGAFSLIAELPFWSSTETDDTSATDLAYAELLSDTGGQLLRSGRRLVELLAVAEPHLTLDTPFLRASRVFAPMVAASGESQLARSALTESQRSATVAERHSAHDLVHMFRLRFGGILLRAFEAEIATGSASAALRQVAGQTREQFESWAHEAAAADTSSALPINALAGVQYGAILAAVFTVGQQ
ncbi:M14 family zinc carboxypeptidase [Demequina sp. NBRC 110051]|uniref:M14 family zinc carboxypeptidase n=1 Tax=Demequina sp. NBRC 110051 TaxID=1570340 RepID=UPI0009FE877D|nr:M14 family zinc carboxypeptidase [Demequina sp. NBRC 110051]